MITQLVGLVRDRTTAFFLPVSTKTLPFYADCLGNAVMGNVAVEGK